MMALHIVLGKDKRVPDIPQLLHERAMAAHAGMDAKLIEQFFDGAFLSGLGVACPVVEQQPTLFYIVCDVYGLVGSVFVIISNNDQHKQCF